MSDSAPDFDFIVIGSGFGGSVAALRLVEKGYRVAIMEMGRRWTADNLPSTNWRLWRWIWRPGLALRGFFNIEPFRHVLIMHGCAVGGGSITYANTLLQPGDSVWDRGSWAGLADWKSQMPAHFQTARRMLGVAENRILGPADHILRRAAEAAGVGHTFYRTQVAVFEPPEGAPPGEPHPDPYFDGAGPPRHTCIALRRLHDGMPLQRQEHARQELPLPGGKRRRPAVRRNPRSGRGARRRKLQRPHRALHGLLSQTAAAVLRPAPWYSPARRSAPWTCCFASSARDPCPSSASASANACAPMPNRSSGCASRGPPRISRWASPSAPASTSMSSPTSRPRAIRRARMPWDCWPRCSPADAPGAPASCTGSPPARHPCCATPSAPCAVFTPSAGPANR